MNTSHRLVEMHAGQRDRLFLLDTQLLNLVARPDLVRLESCIQCFDVLTLMCVSALSLQPRLQSTSIHTPFCSLYYVLSPVSIQTQALALALLRPSIPIAWRLRLLHEIFTQQTQAPANRNARVRIL